MSVKQKVYRVLRWSQKYTKTDNVYLARGGFWLILGRVIYIAVSFLLAVAFANLLDQAVYGNYRYILSLFGFLSVFSLGGMEMAIIQAVARGLEGSFYSGFKTKLKWGTLGSLAAVLMSIYYLIQGNYMLAIALLFFAIFLPLMNALPVYNGFFEGRKLFNIQMKYNTVVHVISTAVLIVILFLTKNIFWLIAAYFISHTILYCFFFFLTRLKFKPNKKDDPQTISYGKHLSVMQVAGVISGYLDKILLFTLVGAVPLAIYSFALSIPSEIVNILRNISILSFPKFSAKSREEIRLSVKQKFWKFCILVGVIILLYIIVCPYIYKIFFPRYLDSIFYSQIYVLSLLTAPTMLMTAAFRAKAMKRELYILQGLSFLRLILFFCLIPFFGILGVLISILGTAFLSTVVTLFLFRKF